MRNFVSGFLLFSVLFSASAYAEMGIFDRKKDTGIFGGFGGGSFGGAGAGGSWGDEEPAKAPVEGDPDFIGPIPIATPTPPKAPVVNTDVDVPNEDINIQDEFVIEQDDLHVDPMKVPAPVAPVVDTDIDIPDEDINIQDNFVVEQDDLHVDPMKVPEEGTDVYKIKIHSKLEYTQQYEVNIEKQRILSAVKKLDEITSNFKLSVWRDKDGNFNTSRLISDSVAGVVLGTAGGLITSSVVKKNQVKNGFEDIGCAIGGQIVAGWGDDFVVDLK